MLLYLFVDVNIMERNRQKQTLCQAAAARRRHQPRIIRTIYPLMPLSTYLQKLSEYCLLLAAKDLQNLICRVSSLETVVVGILFT